MIILLIFLYIERTCYTSQNTRRIKQWRKIPLLTSTRTRHQSQSRLHTLSQGYASTPCSHHLCSSLAVCLTLPHTSGTIPAILFFTGTFTLARDSADVWCPILCTHLAYEDEL